MKKLVVCIALGLSTMSFAASSPALYDEIQNKVSIDLSTIELNRYEEDFVIVNFTIANGKVNINKIDGTQIELKELVVLELNNMQIESDYNSSTVYRYKFTFEKI